MSSGTAQRVLTAVILIPLVVAAIWLGPNWLIALVSAFVAIAAMWEFFSIAEHLGFHAYRLWTCLAAAGIVALQLYASRQTHIASLGDLLDRSPRVTLELVLFGFVLGVAAITLGTRRPMAEALASISVSAAGLLFIVLPFSAVVRLHGVGALGPIFSCSHWSWCGRETPPPILWAAPSGAASWPRNLAQTRPGRARPRIFWERCWWPWPLDTGTGFRPSTCWPWRPWAAWPGKSAISSNPHGNAAPASRIPARFCRGTEECSIGLTPSSWQPLQSGTISNGSS